MQDAIKKVVDLALFDGAKEVVVHYPEFRGQNVHIRMKLGRITSVFIWDDGRVITFQNPRWWSLSQNSTMIDLGAWWKLREGDLRSCK